MNEWKEIRLGDAINLKRGYDLPSTQRQFGEYPVVSSSGISDYHSSFMKEPPGVVTGRYGTIGQVFYINEPYWPLNTTLYVTDFKGNLPKFIYYFLQVFEFEKFNDKSTVPGINRNHLHEEKIYLPPLSEQTAIAEVLSSLDDKIDLLHRQNKTLEQLAETLFRQWFVEEADGSWEVSKIEQEFVTVLGGTPSTTKPEYWDGDIPWINSGEVNRFRIDSPTRYITKLGLEKSNTKLLPKGTTVIAITGATLGQISLLEIDTCANQSVVGIIPNNKLSKEFVFFWVKYKLPDILLNETGGAQPHINKNDVNGAELILPPSDLLNSRIPILKDYFNKISNNIHQISNLTQLRDTLLPKLMSGEVKVN